jgi:PAS domain S-box-containing protein
VFGGHEARLVVARDITKQKEGERALQQAERKYRLIFEEAVVGIYQTTPDGRLLSANPAMARMYGYDSPEEMMSCISNIDAQLYVDPVQREELRRLMLEQGAVRHFETEVYRKDGRKIWLWTNARAVREGDTIVRYEGGLEDITDRKAMQDQPGEAQRQYRDIVENAVIGIFQSTPEWRYLSANPAMAFQAWMMGIRSQPDAIILDINMPGGSGIDVLKRLKTSTKTKHIPVLVVSGSGGSEMKNLVKRLGARTF